MIKIKEYITKQNASTARNPHDVENMMFPLQEDGEMMVTTHQRIDFAHRGILAFTSTPTTPAPFGEFMVTTSEATFLGKDGYNIVGVVQGNTLFNAMRILDKVLAGGEEYVGGEGDEEEGRLVSILGCSNPQNLDPVLDTVKPVWNEVKVEGKKKKKRKAVNDAAVLSFGGDEEEEEEGDWKGKMKKEKKKKKKYEAAAAIALQAEEKEETEKTPALPTPTSLPVGKKKIKAVETPTPAAVPAPAPAQADEESNSDDEPSMSLVDKMRAKYKKGSASKRRKKDQDKEVMEKMMDFKESVKKVKQGGGRERKGEVYFGQVMEKGEDEDDDDEGDWRAGRFDCKKHIDHKSKMID